jgi:hypothetical protein
VGRHCEGSWGGADTRRLSLDAMRRGRMQHAFLALAPFGGYAIDWLGVCDGNSVYAEKRRINSNAGAAPLKKQPWMMECDLALKNCLNSN